MQAVNKPVVNTCSSTVFM